MKSFFFGTDWVIKKNMMCVCVCSTEKIIVDHEKLKIMAPGFTTETTGHSSADI